MSLNQAQRNALLEYLWEENADRIQFESDHLDAKIAKRDAGDPETRNWTTETRAEMAAQRDRRKNLLAALPARPGRQSSRSAGR